MNRSEAHPLQIVALRAEIAQLSLAVAQMRRAGLDHAAAHVLLARKRVQLDGLMRELADSRTVAPDKPARPSR